MSFTTEDFEALERIVSNHADDVAVSIARSFERLEERLDAAESRIYSRLSDIADAIDGARQDVSEHAGYIRDDLRATSARLEHDAGPF